MKMKHAPLVVALALSLAPSAHAEDLMQTIRDKWANATTGRTTTEPAEPSKGVSDSWGSPAPAAPVRQLKPEQQKDVRLSDERYQDDSRRKPTPVSTKSAPAPKSVAQVAALRAADAVAEPVAATTASTPTRTSPRKAAPTSESYIPTAVEPRTAVARGDAACLNVSRTWEGAAALATRGQTDRAYAAYLRLLTACSDEKELLGTAYQAQKNLDTDQLDQLLNEPVLASPRMAKVVMVFTLQHMYAENKAKNFDAALRLSRSIRPAVLRSRDAGALEVSGWLEQQAGDYAQAESLFRAAGAVDKRAGGPPEGLALALLAQGKTEEAAKVVSTITSENADSLRSEVLVAQSRELLKRKDYKGTLKLLDKAESLGRAPDDATIATMGWALRGLGDVEKARDVFAALHEKHKDVEEYQMGLLETASDLHDYNAIKSLVEEEGAATPRAKVILAQHYTEQGRHNMAAELTGERREGLGSELGLAGGVRTKSGKKGEGQLTSIVTPQASAKVALGDHVNLEVKAAALSMDDGVRKINGRDVSVKVTADIDDGEISAKVGSVGPQQGGANTTVDLGYKQYTDSGYIEGHIAREAVLDSTRSFVGGTDAKGVKVGPAMKSKIEVAGKTEVMKDTNLQWNAAGGAITAEGTAANGFFEVGAALTRDFKAKNFSWLNVGPELRLSHFNEDQNQFTGAAGGYYSPTSASDMGLIANALTLEGRRYIAKGAFRSGYTTRTLSYGNESGVYFESDASVAALLYPHLIVGAGFTARTAPGYTESGLRFWLTIPFEARKGLYSSDLKSGQ